MELSTESFRSFHFVSLSSITFQKSIQPPHTPQILFLKLNHSPESTHFPQILDVVFLNLCGLFTNLHLIPASVLNGGQKSLTSKPD